MIYVSLTTIPKRVKNLNKTIESLLRQSQVPDKIFVNVPYKYKRFNDNISDNQIPKFADNRIEVTRCDDYGPGTKLMGSLDKFKENSLIILVDDDNAYENYMIEKFYYYFSVAPENAYSFYVHPLKNFGIGQGADGFAINSKYLNGIKKFYNEIVINNEDLFINDDLWISFYLFYLKKVKILSLQSQIKKKTDNKISLIYSTHNKDGGLISSYAKDINRAVQIRDEKALKSLDIMFEKTKKINF